MSRMHTFLEMVVGFVLVVIQEARLCQVFFHGKKFLCIESIFKAAILWPAAESND